MQLTDFVLTDIDEEMHTDMTLTDLQKMFEPLVSKIILGFKTPVIILFDSTYQIEDSLFLWMMLSWKLEY